MFVCLVFACLMGLAFLSAACPHALHVLVKAPFARNTWGIVRNTSDSVDPLLLRHSALGIAQVQLVADLIRRRKCAVPPDVLRALFALRLTNAVPLQGKRAGAA